jgi:hypothetical protein
VESLAGSYQTVALDAVIKCTAVSPKAASSRLGVTVMLKSTYSSKAMQNFVPASFSSTEVGVRTETNHISQYT